MAGKYHGTSPDKESGMRATDSANKKRGGRVIRLEGKNPETPAAVKDIAPDDIVFAMDIGTRTIAGVIGRQEGDVFHVLATEVCEHKSRAMMDGQIHDIDQAAATAMEVKRRLEYRIGFRLKRVAIAAAGRVLRTCQVKVEKTWNRTWRSTPIW
ncbi:MAG TPA: hypothetical protein PK767_03320 [Clostridiales bacterium]|nr:hypothetical protein [Clostridiales bacterium]